MKINLPEILSRYVAKQVIEAIQDQGRFGIVDLGDGAWCEDAELIVGSLFEEEE